MEILDIVGNVTLVVFVLFLPAWLIIIAHLLGRVNFWFTNVKEGEAKAITVGEKFHKAVMSFGGYAFRRDLFPTDRGIDFTPAEFRWAREQLAIEEKAKAGGEFKKFSKLRQEAEIRKELPAEPASGPPPDEVLRRRHWLENQTGKPDPWDIVRVSDDDIVEQGEVRDFLSKLPLLGKLIGGLHWVGIVPGLIHRIHTFRFAWASLELPMSAEGKPGGEKVVVPQMDKNMDRVFVRQDVYAIVIRNTPTKQGLPLSITLSVPMAVRNPKKAMFGVEHWLEALTNVLESTVRELVGRHTYAEIYGGKEGFSQVIREKLRDSLATFRRDWGIKVFDEAQMGIGVFALNLVRDTDIDLTVLDFKTAREAKAVETMAKARGTEAQLVLSRIAAHGGEKAVEAHLLAGANSKLTTLVQGKGRAMVSLPTPPSTPSQNPADSKTPRASRATPAPRTEPGNQEKSPPDDEEAP